MNNQAKCNHTPGPWYVSGTGNHQAIIIGEATGENVAVAYDGEANAHLIAAAPELLEMLKRMIRAFNVAEVDPLTAFTTIEQALGAIAKAEASQ